MDCLTWQKQEQQDAGEDGIAVEHLCLWQGNVIDRVSDCSCEARQPKIAENGSPKQKGQWTGSSLSFEQVEMGGPGDTFIEKELQRNTPTLATELPDRSVTVKDQNRILFPEADDERAIRWGTKPAPLHLEPAIRTLSVACSPPTGSSPCVGLGGTTEDDANEARGSRQVQIRTSP